MKTAVIYARYCSDRQTEQSIEGQVRVCNDYAERNDILIVNQYIDRATTGTNDNREAFQQMMKDSDKKAWDFVLVYKKEGPKVRPRLGADELSRLDGLVSPRIRLGQSAHHIHATDPEVAAICSERTLRRILCDGLLSAKAHELRRYVRFKRRLPGGKEARRLVVSDVRKLLGRMHQDYLDCVASNPEAPTCQLDSVIGKAEDAKAILTIAWPESNFQVGLLVDKGRPESARKAILKAMRAVAKACLGRRRNLRQDLLREALRIRKVDKKKVRLLPAI